MFYYIGSKVVGIFASDESAYKYKVLIEFDSTILPFPYYTNREYNVGDKFDG